MRELTEAGYIKRQPVRTSEGTLQGSEWVIVDDPDRATEEPSLGDTEALKTRDPENPTVGKPAPIRRPTGQEDQSLCPDGTGEPGLSKNETTASDHASMFDEFFAAYPRPKNRDRSEAEFSKAVKAGADPARIIAAAKAYAAENRGNARHYVAYSDNWLRDRRWEDQREVRPGHKANLRQTIERMLQSPVPAVRDQGRTLARVHRLVSTHDLEMEAAA